MNKMKRFEDLPVWKESRVFVKDIYSICNNNYIKKDYGFKDQIQRASVSIITNIAEGFERNNNKEFVRFLVYSKGSVGEVRSLLYIALDLNYIGKDEFDRTYEMSLSIVKQISNFIKYLKNYKK